MGRFHTVKFIALQALIFVARASIPQLNITNINSTILGNVTSDISWSNTTGTICRRDAETCEPDRLLALLDFGHDLDEPEIADIDYFRFSTENIALSRADDWYAAWTAARQNDSEWPELGEWKLFAKDFAKTYNFECDLTFGACVDYPSLGDIQNMWPGPQHRPLVRRIFFTFHRFAIAHDYVRAIDVRCSHICNSWFYPTLLHKAQWPSTICAHGSLMLSYGNWKAHCLSPAPFVLVANPSASVHVSYSI